MANMEITLTVSQDVARYVKFGADGEPNLHGQAMLLYPAIADMTISHGRAAELLGIPKWDLIELYAGMGIPYLTQTWEEAQEDSRAIEEAMRLDEARTVRELRQPRAPREGKRSVGAALSFLPCLD